MFNEKEYQEWLRTEYKPIMGSGGGGYTAPPPSPEETALMQTQLEMLQQSRAESELMKPYLLQALGLVAEGTGYRRMTEDEKLAGMTSTERSDYQILQLQQERQLAALQGKLPVSPALEEDIAKQESDMKESLSRRLGSGWETTTSGIQAKSEFDKRAGLLREEARRGEITTGQGLLLSQEGYMTGANQAQQQGYTGYGQRLFPLVQGYGQAQQPYQYNRSLEMQANMANAQSSSGMWGGLGSLLGAGATMGGSIVMAGAL